MIKLFTLRLTAMAGALLWGVSPGWAQQANTQLTTTNSQVQDTIKNAQADQKTTTLQEVVVESASRKRIPQGIAFFPSKKEKNFATDAENLIQIMTLPELPYDYRNKVVTTASGLGVTYFIDGREASKKEINLINPKDVERIEYFPMPTSGDFVGKKNVVNYVMKKYLSGGYTRISAQQYLEGTYGNYYLASRLVHKKVTFDGYFDGGYINTKKSGTLTTNTYKDFTYNSTHYDRVEETLDGRDNKSRRNDMGAFIRAIWQHRALDLTTTIGWNWQQQPEVINRSATSYTPEIFNSNFVTTRSNSLNINPYARIVAKLKLPRKQTLTFNLVGKYLSEQGSSLYSPQNLDPIFNATQGKDWTFLGLVSYSKTFNAKNSLGLEAHVSYDLNEINYSGSFDGPNKYSSTSTSFSATYSHNFNDDTSISISGGFDNDLQRINGKKTSIWTPSAYMDFSHDWNDKSSFRLSTSVFLNGYPGSYLNDVTLRASELLWVRGNPNLKNRISWQSTVTNTWNLSKNFSFALNGLYTHTYNQDFDIWYVEPGRDGIIRTTDDNGDLDWWRAGTKLTYKLFNRKLVLTGSFDYDFYKFSGFYDKTKSYVKGSAAATWYGNKWYAGLVLVPATVAPYYNSIVEVYDNWLWTINLGYTYKNLNLRFSMVNPFGSDLTKVRWTETEHFSQHRKSYTTFMCNSFRLTAVYTFSYGKKVRAVNMQKNGMQDSGALSIEK